MTAALATPHPLFSHNRYIRIIAAGKAAWPMAQAACAMLGPRLSAGVLAGPLGRGQLPAAIECVDAPHPLPDARSVRAARRALDLAAAGGDAGEHLLVLLSGGASAMLAAPAGALSLEDKRQATGALMRAGAGIADLNCVRKHLSAIKGGRLALAAGSCTTLALSDVHAPEDDPATIGSGPTAVDPTTYRDAIAVLERWPCRVPGAVRDHLASGAEGRIEETAKPGDPRLAGSRFIVIGNRRTAMDGGEREAARRGYSVRVAAQATDGEARVAGALFAEASLAAAPGGRTCRIASGETTVTVRGDGRGGRNQEFVLAAAAVLARDGRPAVVASAGSDGIDGPTDAAGGIVSTATVARAMTAGIDLDDALARNDAYTALARLGDLIVWGPTLTNVGDLHVVLTIRP